MSQLWGGGEAQLQPPAVLEIYPEERLYEEISFIAYYFHWDNDKILDLPHWERQKWCEEISKINKKVSSDEKKEISLLDLM